MPMLKKHYVLSIAAYFSIPAVVILGATLSNAIDPEIAARTADYSRNYQLLSLLKGLILFIALLICGVLWFMTCSFLLRSKERSQRWLLLALLGPFGFAGLSMLDDNAPSPKDRYQHFVQRLTLIVRIAYELFVFSIIWVTSFLTMVLIRGLMIIVQSIRTGMSVAQIIDLQNASSGMYAFSEGLQVLYLVTAFYLLWPLCYNIFTRLPALWASLRNS